MENLRIDYPGGRATDVLVGPGALGRLPECWSPAWDEAAVIGDRNVIGLHGDKVAQALAGRPRRVVVLDFPAGEASKTRARKEHLEDRLLDRGVGRDACIVAVGGGVSLDLAGFVAATFLRGVPWVAIPTSLLAQVDASIGGKTGVDTPHGKNLVGAFHQPSCVIADPDLLATLPAAEWPNGLAEMVKHGMVADPELFGWLERNATPLAAPGTIDPWPIRRCIELKAGIVAGDEREAGRRAVLNFGHTAGHAIERAANWAIPHGEAVALGMRIESRIAVRLAGLGEEARLRLVALLDALGLGRATAPAFDEASRFLDTDKKRQRGELRMALPAALGTMARDREAWTLAVPIEALREAWDHDLR